MARLSVGRPNCSPLQVAKYVTLIGAAVSLCVFVSCLDEELQHQPANANQDGEQLEWWKTANYYHIYLRSFKDSDGDGNGDLLGVVKKLDYLKEIGVDTILMAPFYASPMKDGGYDISDYEAINPMFGTMRDFETLVEELERREMRIVVDFVPNHSSDEHRWFKCSERAFIDPENCGKYRDYYVWMNSTRFEAKYPTNWISVFGGGSAWQWSDVRKEFYLHQFLPEQPDLNFTNPEVREEFKRIARFWLDKKVHGLRVDSAIYLVEDRAFRDEPEDASWYVGKDPADRLLHVHTRSLHQSAEIVRDWREEAERKRQLDGVPRVIITEAYDKIDKLIEYYGNSPADRFADMPFNFELLKLNKYNFESVAEIKHLIMNWIRPTRELQWPDEHGAMSPWICWVTGNHDNKRLMNRIGEPNFQLFKFITYMMPGAPVNYYGDELALYDLNPDQIPAATISEGESSRLPERGPIAWVGGTVQNPSGGFSESEKSWLPLNGNNGTNNVARLMAEIEKSPNQLNSLNLFIKLQNLRQSHKSALIYGDMVFFKNLPTQSGDSVLALGRVLDQDRAESSLLLVANLDPFNSRKLQLQKTENQRQIFRPNDRVPESFQAPSSGRVELTNFESEQVKLGAQIDQLDGFVLKPKQALILSFRSS